MAALRLGRGEKVDAPYLLTYALQCERWGALPEAGGLRDQPAGMLDKMAYIVTVHKATKGYWSADDTVKWSERNPELWDFYTRARQIESIINE